MMTVSRNVDWISILGLLLLFATGCDSQLPEKFDEVSRKPVIYPDYAEITIPPNIAPMNFVIEEEGDRFFTVVSPETGDAIVLSGKTVDIPLSRWSRITAANKGADLRIEIFVRCNGRWKKFQPIVNHVAKTPVDAWLSYRLIAPGYEHYSQVGLYQRNLETFDESPFFRGNLVDEKTCTNCHSFQNRSTDSFLFHTRNTLGGTVFVHDGEIVKVDTKTAETGMNCAYPSWHPFLPIVAFSVNGTSQIFHSLSPNKIEVFDSFSDLVLYDVEKRTLTHVLPKSDDCFETLPSWSPDGKTLYYCEARMHLNEPRENLPQRKGEVIHRHTEFKYNLMKMPFDPASRTFGDPETMVDAAASGKSAVFPRVSPDGKSLVYTLSDYGTFPIWHRESDLWLLDMATAESRRLDEVNSDEAESYHVWSSTGRWLAFSSRRDDGSYTRLYFTHHNEDGSFSKPFLLPQKDPMSNIALMKSYNVPELTTKPVEIDMTKLVRAAKNPDPEKVTYVALEGRNEAPVRGRPAENNGTE